MMSLLSQKFWLCLALVAALTFTHVFVYKSGKAAVRLDWDKERAEQMSDALKASEANRVKEAALNLANMKVTNDYNAHKKLSAAAAVVSSDKLRDLQAAVDSSASANTAACSGTDGPYSAIINQCTGALVRVDNYAQEMAGKARALQDYAKLLRVSE